MKANKLVVKKNPNYRSDAELLIVRYTLLQNCACHV